MHSGVVASQQASGTFFLQSIALAVEGNEEPVGRVAGKAAIELAGVTLLPGAALEAVAAEVSGRAGAALEAVAAEVSGRAGAALEAVAAEVSGRAGAVLEAVAAEVSGRAGAVLGEAQATMTPTRITALGATQPSPRRRALRWIIAEA
jgi:hypothetical protein